MNFFQHFVLGCHGEWQILAVLGTGVGTAIAFGRRHLTAWWNRIRGTNR